MRRTTGASGATRAGSRGQVTTALPERPIATVPQVFALALAVPLHLRALILAATFTGLRWCELIALRRCDIDLAAGVLRVHRSLSEMRGGVMREKPPKSEAGVRTVALTTVLVEDFRTHLAEHGEPGSTVLIFVGDRGGPLRRGNFHRATKWTATVVRLGLPLGFHFHDLRHTGNQLVAESGAS